MADPITYSIAYSFSGFQAISPDSPLPASQLDVELQNIETSIDSIATALGEVRRSDGNLQNGIVSWDGLSDDVKAKFDNLDNRVVVGDINPAAFATQAESEAAVAGDRLATPQSIGWALEALRGFASQAQAQTGTDNTTVVTPLRVREALDTLRALASQAQAQTGVDNAAVMTPLRTAQAIDSRREAHTASVQLTWGAIAANSSAEQTISVADAEVGDRVILGLPATGPSAGFVADAWVSSAGNVTVRLTNTTAGSLTPYAGVAQTFRATVVGF